MVNDIFLPSSTPETNMKNTTITGDKPLIDGTDPLASVSRDHQPKPPSSYLSMSIGDNRQFGLSDFHDPLFYQEPLHLHYNQSLPFKIESEHETGDRVRTTNKSKMNEYRKSRSVTSRKHQSKKSKSKLVKTREKKKKPSRRTLKERKQKRKTVRRNQKKKNLLKQRIRSKKRSISKVNRNKSSTSKYGRKSNTTNSRMASTTSNTQLALDEMHQQANASIFNSVQQSTGVQITDEVKHSLSTPSNILPTRASMKTKLEQNSSKKSLRRSKLNVRKRSTSKSKQTKQRKRARTKLHIRSPVHTTFKKKARRYQTRRSTRNKKRFPRCTSKTLITMGRLNTNHENMVEPMDAQNDDIRAKLPTSSFSAENNFVRKQSTMPLTKNCAQLNSKNNNRRRRNRFISKRKSKKSTGR